MVKRLCWASFFGDPHFLVAQICKQLVRQLLHDCHHKKDFGSQSTFCYTFRSVRTVSHALVDLHYDPMRRRLGPDLLVVDEGDVLNHLVLQGGCKGTTSVARTIG